MPGECSSGDKQQYTGITKAGNSHLRKLLVETAQVFGRSATKSGKSVALKERQAKCDSLTVAYADKANARLNLTVSLARKLAHAMATQDEFNRDYFTALASYITLGEQGRVVLHTKTETEVTLDDGSNESP